MTQGLPTVLSRYLLFQLPELVLVGVALLLLVGLNVLAANVGWLLLGVWFVKEVVLFPFVRRAYEPSDPSGTASMVGATAVVINRLDLAGTVRIGPELWAACLDAGSEPAEVGATVRVKSVKGLTLHVVEAGE
ncbi:MAG: NfeD family protein [Myxococcota bacterium]|nr:NfeD family protein [Myxococcota bacterium]